MSYLQKDAVKNLKQDELDLEYMRKNNLPIYKGKNYTQTVDSFIKNVISCKKLEGYSQKVFLMIY